MIGYKNTISGGSSIKANQNTKEYEKCYPCDEPYIGDRKINAQNASLRMQFGSNKGGAMA